jgi:asparagine synthase (glutamine-hydrolysing)
MDNSMCGISGFNWKDESLIKSMMNSMTHRGPDDSGSFIEDGISLGHQRLSIIDLSTSGHQPMFDEEKKYAIIYNGEIYNFNDVKDELNKIGYKFVTNSDTEVIIQAYKEWGYDCLKKFKGMFAFAIYDMKKEILFLARDHAGIKPLFYFMDKERFIFSSTISALLLHDIVRKPNRAMIRDYLLYNITDHSEETFFTGIKRFPKGHYAIYKLKTKSIEFHKWWEIKFTNDYPGTYDDAVSRLRELMRISVERHLISDVPVGTCLSGGIDSTSIACLINETKRTSMMTFSAVFPNYIKDETKFIKLATENAGMVNHKVEPTVDNIKIDLNKFIEIMSVPPHNTSPYAQYKVFQLAKSKGITVLLDGQGADELLAGYHYFYGFYIKGLLKNWKIATAIKEVFGLIRGANYSIGIKSLGFSFMPLSMRNKHFVKKSSITEKLLNDKDATTDYFKEYYSCSTLHESLKFHLDRKLEHLLSWEDKNSMAHSMEGRVPFLDVDVIKFICTLPENFIISNGKTKTILRDAMTGIVPEEILSRRDKIGFDTPGDEWLRNDSFKPMLDEISSGKSRCSPYIDHRKMKTMITDTISGKSDYSKHIWKAIILERWLEMFFSDEIKASRRSG